MITVTVALPNELIVMAPRPVSVVRISYQGSGATNQLVCCITFGRSDVLLWRRELFRESVQCVRSIAAWIAACGRNTVELPQLLVVCLGVRRADSLSELLVHLVGFDALFRRQYLIKLR